MLENWSPIHSKDTPLKAYLGAADVCPIFEMFKL